MEVLDALLQLTSEPLRKHHQGLMKCLRIALDHTAVGLIDVHGMGWT